MKRIGLMGMAVAGWLAAAACGGDTDVMGGGGSGGSSSGTGGSTSSGTGGSGTGGSTSSGTGGNISSGTGGSTSSGTGGSVSGGACEQACEYLATDCGFPNACDNIPGMDCATASSDCRGLCLLDASCAEIATLATNSPDPTLVACLQTCGGGGGNCQQCIFQSCGDELQACQQEAACMAYIQCVQGCQGNTQCIDACLTSNPSAEADALSACSCASCANECPFCG